MQRAMLGFHQDAEGHWVAELSCGHGQHVRHQPPFTLCPWVVSAEGRAGRIGQALDCPLCDRAELPAGYEAYRRTSVFTEESIPDALRRRHRLKAGAWGVIHVVSGELEYVVEDTSTRRVVAAGELVRVAPEVEHHVAPLGEVGFFIEFWRAARAASSP